MGVLGLWRLIDASGKPVPLETLEGKVLAVDVSIWIHQVIQGYQDRRGNSIPNAHLIGLFNRICKLLYFKIKPVFVFDGGVPLLKKNTIATRRKLKSIAASKAQKLKNDLINNLIKHTAVKGALEGKNEGESSSSQPIKDTSVISDISKLQDMYKLPDIPTSSKLDDSDYIHSDDDDDLLELSPRKQTKWIGNIHSVDVNTEEFKNLPADVRYDILTDLKETRKQNSWGRIHELPAGSDNYSGFQVNRLMKRRYVQESLEVAEKEMGGRTLTLEELDRLLTDQGINTTQKQDAAFRIASDSTTRVIYMKDMSESQTNENSSNSNESEQKTKDEKTVDSMSIHSDSSVAVVDDIKAYDLDEDWNSDDGLTDVTLNESQLLPKSLIPKSVMNPALSYMLENSGLTKEQILKIVEQSKKNKKKSEGASSHGSSTRKKKGSRRSSLLHKSMKKKLFDTGISESPEMKKEPMSDTDTVKTIESSSEDDFVEIPDEEDKIRKDALIQEKVSADKVAVKNKNDPDKTITMESESESDDFIEIQDVPIPEFGDTKAKSNLFEIKIETVDDLEEDIFADVFSDLNSVKKIDEVIENEIAVNKIEDLAVLKDETLVRIGIKKEPDQIKVEEPSFVEGKSADQLDCSTMSLPTAPQKVNPITKENDTSLTPTKSEEASVIEEVTDQSKAQYVTIELDDDEPNDRNDIKDREQIVEDKIENSEMKSQERTTEKSINEKEKSDKEIVDIDNELTFNEEDFEEPMDIQREPPPLVLPRDEMELESMKQQLESEQQKIAGTLGKLERQAIDITDQMRMEAQELLRLFGIPYLVAPMEAEAQCAFLEQIKLTDGTITDDSDVWLFGGQCVYKNFFDNNKKVLQFLSKDIEHHFKLTRRELIQLALLVGSDYTNGLAGVGPVTALEIIASFPSEGEDILRGLRAFCGWFRAGKLTAPGRITLRNKLKNVQIEKGFPSQAVVQAYVNPTVDESKDAFTWGKPNLVLLADYVKKKFGWTKLKFEEIMNPVMQKMNEGKSQKGIHQYFKVHTVPKSIETTLSKRVQSAVQRMGGLSQDTNISDDEDKPSTSTAVEKKPKRERKTTAKKGKEPVSESGELPAIAESHEDEVMPELNNVDEIRPKTSRIHVFEDDGEEIQPEPGKKRKYDSNRGRARKIIQRDIIPQREKDKANALKTKLKAIEIFRKSKQGPGRVHKGKKTTMRIKDDAELSESSSSSSS